MKVITDPNQIDKKKWSDFVSNHPNGNVFQTHEMYEVYKKTKNYSPVLISVTDNKGNIKGILLAVVQREKSGILGIMTARSIIFGGPLVANNDRKIFNTIVEKYNVMVNRSPKLFQTE